MRQEWTLLPRDDFRTQSAGLYVSMNPLGEIVINGFTHTRLGAPAAFQILFDGVNNRIALKPADLGMKHAYPARKRGRTGARIIRAYRLLKEFGLKLPDTMEFQDIAIEEQMLVMDLRTARISPKAHSQCRTKTAGRP
ncbi:MAG: hypothetical protein AB7J13_05180 [Pyrinomonadaceae bacterium]